MRGLGVLSARGRLAAIREDITRQGNGGGAPGSAPAAPRRPVFPLRLLVPNCAYSSQPLPVRP